MTQAVASCVEKTSGGNARVMARELGLKAPTLQDWRAGRGIPCSWLLFRLCYRLGITPLQILTNDIHVLAPTAANLPELGQPFRRSVPASRPINVAEVQRALEAVPANDEFPPPSMREVADRLGRYVRPLQRRLPELCRAISVRYLDYRKKLALQRRERLCAEVRQAVWTIHGQGLYPNTKRMAPLISQPGFLRAPVAQATRRAALQELGWQR